MEVSSKRVVGLALLGLVISSSSLAQSGSDILSLYERGLPFVINTFEIDEIRVVPIKGLENPFSMAFRDNGDILVTERYTGKLKVVRDGELLAEDLSGVPETVTGEFRSGLMAVALHPNDDRQVYLTNHKHIMVDGEE